MRELFVYCFLWFFFFLDINFIYCVVFFSGSGYLYFSFVCHFYPQVLVLLYLFASSCPISCSLFLFFLPCIICNFITQNWGRLIPHCPSVCLSIISGHVSAIDLLLCVGFQSKLHTEQSPWEVSLTNSGHSLVQKVTPWSLKDHSLG